MSEFILHRQDWILIFHIINLLYFFIMRATNILLVTICSLSLLLSCDKISKVKENDEQAELPEETLLKSGDVDWDSMAKNTVSGKYFKEDVDAIRFFNNCYVDETYPALLRRYILAGADVFELSCIGSEDLPYDSHHCIVIGVPNGTTAGEVEVSVNFLSFGGCLLDSYGIYKATAIIEGSLSKENGSGPVSVKLTLSNEEKIHLVFDSVTEGSVFEHVEFGHPLPF